MQQDFRVPGQQGAIARAPETGLTALHMAARRLADAKRTAGRFRTRELVALLMAHGARSWRASLPEVEVRLKAIGPTGMTAVRLRLR